MTTLTRRDAAATGLVALAVGAYLATHESWDVWLVGHSHRWTAVVVLALGIGAYLLDARLDEFPGLRTFVYVGYAAIALAAITVATGSLTPLSLLVAGIVVCWAITTAGHLGSAHAPASARPQ